MTEPNRVPETNPTTDLAKTSQATNPAEAGPPTDLVKADQPTDLAPVPQQTNLAPYEQKLLALLPEEDPDTGAFSLREPPMSFDEDLRTQERTPMNLKYLRLKQRAVLAEMMKGKAIKDIARDEQISRNTIHYWMRHDDKFIAAVRAWRRRAREEAADQLLVLTGRAVTTVTRAVYDNNLRAALSVLKSQGLLDRPSRARPRAHKRAKPMTPNVVMEHSRTTVAMSVPTATPLP